jgi:hypothetical protein
MLKCCLPDRMEQLRKTFFSGNCWNLTANIESWVLTESVLATGLCSFKVETTVALHGCSCRLRLKCDGICAETRFLLSAKRTSPFKSAGASVQSTNGSWAVRISLQGFVLLVQACVLQSCDAYWLPTPFSCFPFTSPPVCHHTANGQFWAFRVNTVESLDCWDKISATFTSRPISEIQLH